MAYDDYNGRFAVQEWLCETNEIKAFLISMPEFPYSVEKYYFYSSHLEKLYISNKVATTA